MDQKSKIKYTTIVNKYPSFRDESIKSCWRWLEGRQEDDNAEGYWRVHDKLYNLNDFIKNHPGGSEWIALSKGTDITEAFESYHILPKASNVLKKFYVKDADKPRNYKLTYEDNGFYRTLKRRVAEKLPFLDRNDLWKSKFALDVIVCGFLVSCIMAMRVEGILLKTFFILLASQCAAWMNAGSHNFNHQRDSWRMYSANFILIGWRDWRVFHGMSHHLYPNSFTDLEISAYEPTFHWIPVQPRSTLQIIFSYVMTPVIYMLLFHSSLISRYYGIIFAKSKIFHLDELLILVPPALMFIFGNSSLTICNIKSIIYIWGIILMTGSFLYSLMAVNAGHHGYSIVHEGDEFKSLDFGIYQMAATVDRKEANYSVPVSITHFGDHTLHHLFPSLDHALLPQLREILYETCKEFDLELRKWTLLHAAVEQFKQLARTKVTTLD